MLKHRPATSLHPYSRSRSITSLFSHHALSLQPLYGLLQPFFCSFPSLVYSFPLHLFTANCIGHPPLIGRIDLFRDHRPLRTLLSPHSRPVIIRQDAAYHHSPPCRHGSLRAGRADSEGSFDGEAWAPKDRFIQSNDFRSASSPPPPWQQYQRWQEPFP